MTPATPSKFSVTQTPPAEKLEQQPEVTVEKTVEQKVEETEKVKETPKEVVAEVEKEKEELPKPKRGVEKFTKKEVVQAASTEPNYKELYEQSEKKYKTIADEIEGNPFLNKALKAKQEGKNLLDELKPLVAEDPANFDDEQLLRRDLKRKGKDAAYIEKEIENFNSIESDYQRENIIEPLKQKEIAAYNEKSKAYSIEDFLKSKEPSETEVTYKKALIAEVASNDNKEFYGIIQNSDITKKTLDLIQQGKESRAYDEKGNLDVERTMKATFAANNWDLLITTVLNEGIELGKTKVLEEENGNRPLHTGTGTSNQQTLTPMEKIKKGSKITVVEAQN